MQGLAPERVVYMGTVSKTLAPALRLGWLVLPARLLDAVMGAKALSDGGCPRWISSRSRGCSRRAPTIGTCARLAGATGRDAMRSCCRRARHLPGARVTGLAAGLHATVRLGRVRSTGSKLCMPPERARWACIRSGTPTWRPRPVHDGLILGYANLAEPAIEEGIRRLARALEEVAC